MVRRDGLYGRLRERSGAGGDALYVFVAGLIAMSVSGILAFLLGQPLIFPSLGPTVYLFFETPMSEAASPRNTILGHFIGVFVGLAMLWAFGLLGEPSVAQAGTSLAYAAAGALSVAVTGALQLLTRTWHAPAGATTLIVSLGVLGTVRDALVLAVGIVVLTATGWAINRFAGIPVSVWAAKQ